MEDRFPHLGNIDVYKYENTFDYDRWKESTRLSMVNVPWCGDYDNVVEFEDEAARDVYLDALASEGVDMPTRFNVKPDGSAKLPVPIERVQLYNYLIVDIPALPTEGEPIAHEGAPRVSRYLYFIADAVQVAPNTTRVILTLDVWQTFIYQMRFDYVLLERGHAPVAAVNAVDYLANPRANSALLLTDDVNTGGEPYIEASKVTRNYSAEDQWACVATYANLEGAWGSATAPTVPAIPESDTDGVPAPRVYAMEITALHNFLGEVETRIPWFKPCILGLFFAPKGVIRAGRTFKWQGIDVHVCDTVERVERFIKPVLGDFGYPEQARDFAKLYTWPYAAIRVSDETGAASTVRVEDLGAGGIEVADALNAIMPAVRLESRLLGIAGAPDSLTFKTMDGRAYSYGGAWGDFIKSWDVPVFQVSQSAAKHADYTTVYNRQHAQFAADNALASAQASNATAVTNAGNTAANMRDTQRVANNANTSITTNSNSAALDGSTAANNKLAADCTSDNAATVALSDLKNDVIAITTANNNAAGVARSIGSVVTGTLTGGAAGLTGSVVSGVVDNVVALPQANAAAAISQSSNSNAAGIAQSNALEKTLHAAQYTAQTYGIQSRTATNNTNIRNDMGTYISNANATLTTTNAGNTSATGNANAQRAHDTAIDAIDAALDQAGVEAPVAFGASANLASIATAPRMLCAQVVTQRDCDILNAASAFARYGYSLIREWSMGRMQVMRHFTYWKCAEVWCSGAGDAIEGAQNAIKDILVKGVTVWSDPDEIGKVSIYDNIK